MQRYLIRRVLFSVFAIWATVTLTFFFMRALPGDPVTNLVGTEGDPETIELIKNRLGLDRSMPVQYFYYLRSVSTLDLGESVYLRLPVTQILWEALPRTLALGSISFIIGVGIGVPAGIISAIRRYSVWDTSPHFLPSPG